MIEPVRFTSDMQPKSGAFVCDPSTWLLAYSFRHVNLAANSTLRSVEHVTRLLHAKTHSEAMKLSHDCCQAHMDILNDHASCATDFLYEIALLAAEPFRTKAILPCSVIL
jgi:hypothetical protein